MAVQMKMFGFSTGEVSVPVWVRTDIDKYFSSCRKLENFDVDVTGKISRRKGAQFLASHDALGDNYNVFFYVGEFLGSNVLFLFWVDNTSTSATLNCARYVLDADEPAWVELSSEVKCDGTRLDAQSVRFRQYNDALFICGPGLPVCEIQLITLGTSYYPDTYTFTYKYDSSSSEADYTNEKPDEDGTVSQEHVAELVDSSTGMYEWSYAKEITTETEVEISEEEYDVFDLYTQSVAGPMCPDCTYEATLNDDYTVTLTMTGTTSITQYTSIHWYNDHKYVGPLAWCYNNDSNINTYKYGERTLQLKVPTGVFKSVKMVESESIYDKYTAATTSSNKQYVPTDAIYSATFKCTLTDEMLETVKTTTCNFTVPLQLQATELEEWYATSVTLEEIESNDCFSMEVTYDITGYTTYTVQQIFSDALTEYTPTVDEFDFTVPPLLPFTTLSEGSFTVSGTDFTFPSDDEVEYSDKISRNVVRNSTIIALQDDSTESIYEDWGKWDANGACAGSAKEGDVSDVYYASGNTTLTFFSSGGRWTGQLALQVSYDLPSVDDDECEWIDVGYITAAADGTLSANVSHKIAHYNARVRVKLVEREAATYYWCNETEDDKKGEYIADMGCKWTLRISGERRYYFKRTSSIFSRTCTVERLNVAPDEIECNGYTVGAFSDDLGYPLTIDIAQQRLWFFSTDGYPKHFWGSRIDDIKNFSTGSEADDGLCFEAETGVQDYARWLKYGKGQFQFGCARSEGNLVGKDNQYSLNPTSLALENESAWGSADSDAILLADKIFFIKAGRRIIHAQVYDAGRARYVSGEVNVLARHLFQAGTEAMKIVGTYAPLNNLYVLRADGQIARYAFNEDQNVDSWSRYVFSEDAGVTVKDLGVIYGSASDMVVMMMLDGDGKIYFAGIDETAEGDGAYRDYLISADDDDSFSYTSTVTTNAMSVSEDMSYGGKVQIVKLDVYGDGIGPFNITFEGGGSDESAKQQTHFDRYTGALVDSVSGRARCSWKGTYSDAAVVTIDTDYEGEFSLMAIAAEINRTH